MKDVAVLINGRAYKKHEMLSKGKYPLMRVGNFFSNRGWFYSDLELPAKQYCDNGDLLYAWSASFGPRIWDGEKVIYHYHIWKLDLNEKLVDKNYLYYVLQSDVERIKQEQGSGSTMVHVTKMAMENREIPLPPLETQKQIAAVLEKADQLRKDCKQMEQELNSLAQSVFIDMFGDPVTNPKGWPATTLGDFLEFAKDGPHVSPKYSDKGIPFLSTRHIKPSGVKWEDLKYVSSEEAAMHWKKCKPQLGDVLYTKGGTTGIACSVDFIADFAVWVHVALLRPLAGKVDYVWLTNMLNTNYCYQQSQKQTRGATNKDLGLTRMIDIEMYNPPLEMQLKFSIFIKGLNEQLIRNNESKAQNDELFNSLMQKAFKGELSLKSTKKVA